MILIDDNSESVGMNMPNAFQIAPFEGEQDDEEWLTVFNQLIKRLL